MICTTLQIQKDFKNNTAITRAVKKLEKEGWSVNIQSAEDTEEELNDEDEE
jgi:hypothetical protein